MNDDMRGREGGSLISIFHPHNRSRWPYEFNVGVSMGTGGYPWDDRPPASLCGYRYRVSLL